MSVSSSELVGAVVVSAIDPTWLSATVPLFVMSTARSTVSPGTRPDAPVVSRFAAPRMIETVPEVSAWFCALVELVKAANVPRPAMLAAAPTTASEASNLGVVARRRI